LIGSAAVVPDFLLDVNCHMTVFANSFHPMPQARLFCGTASVTAFVDDLKQAKLDQKVVVLAFSEFGRRVQENESQGTNHGTAGPVFVAGTHVKGGLYGDVPNLSDLEQGDLKVKLDFRQVYSTLLDKWLKVPSEQVLQRKYDSLNFILPSS
jgi:uncharacterized protein (DUF1501 family)